MKRTDIIRRAGRNLRQAKLRTLFTSMAIAVGAFTIMMALAAGAGTRDYTATILESNIDPQSLFVVKDPALFAFNNGASSGLELYDENSNAGVISATNVPPDIEPLTQADIDTIAEQDYIASITPIYTFSTEYVTFGGVDKKYAAQVSYYDPNVLPETVAGQLPERGTDLQPGQIAIPKSYAEELDVTPESLIGTTITVTVEKPAQVLSQDTINQLVADGEQDKIAELSKSEQKTVRFTIVAVENAAVTGFGSNGEPSAYISEQDTRELYDYTTQDTPAYGKFIGANAIVRDGDSPQDARTNIEKLGYQARTAEDLQQLIFQFVNVLQWIVTGFGVLALVASIFGIINTMYISVLERTNQIGLMRALGASGRSVAKLFRYEAAWIGLLGGVIGIVVAAIAIVLLNPWVNEILDLGKDNYLLKFVWWQAGILLLGLMVIAIIAGWWPARKAAKLDPIEALRTE